MTKERQVGELRDAVIGRTVPSGSQRGTVLFSLSPLRTSGSVLGYFWLPQLGDCYWLGMLLDILQCTRQHAAAETPGPAMSAVPPLGNPCSSDVHSGVAAFSGLSLAEDVAWDDLQGPGFVLRALCVACIELASLSSYRTYVITAQTALWE